MLYAKEVTESGADLRKYNVCLEKGSEFFGPAVCTGGKIYIIYLIYYIPFQNFLPFSMYVYIVTRNVRECYMYLFNGRASISL